MRICSTIETGRAGDEHEQIICSACLECHSLQLQCICLGMHSTAALPKSMASNCEAPTSHAQT
jgi:hypothetical protein